MAGGGGEKKEGAMGDERGASEIKRKRGVKAGKGTSGGIPV